MLGYQKIEVSKNKIFYKYDDSDVTIHSLIVVNLLIKFN